MRRSPFCRPCRVRARASGPSRRGPSPPDARRRAPAEPERGRRSGTDARGRTPSPASVVSSGGDPAAASRPHQGAAGGAAAPAARARLLRVLYGRLEVRRTWGGRGLRGDAGAAAVRREPCPRRPDLGPLARFPRRRVRLRGGSPCPGSDPCAGARRRHARRRHARPTPPASRAPRHAGDTRTPAASLPSRGRRPRGSRPAGGSRRHTGLSAVSPRPGPSRYLVLLGAASAPFLTARVTALGPVEETHH